jgi:transcriptional regulator with XRE-family HTH domain
MTDGLSPTLRRWDLGEDLRRIRESQGKTIEEVSADLMALHGTGFSAAKISRLETGSRGANPRDVRDLCAYYGVDATEQERLVGLARAVRLENRLQSLRLAYPEYVALEGRAKTLHVYEPMYIPGLLQTYEYHRATYETTRQAGLVQDLSEDAFKDMAQVREERKRRMTGPDALVINAVIDENVIHRLVGSDRIMAEQLSHLLEVSGQPNVTLRVVPLSNGLYPGCESAGFSMLGLGQAGTTREYACYLEGLVASVWAERATDLATVSNVFAYVETIALDPQESHELIADTLRRLS